MRSMHTYIRTYTCTYCNTYIHKYSRARADRCLKALPLATLATFPRRTWRRRSATASRRGRGNAMLSEEGETLGSPMQPRARRRRVPAATKTRNNNILMAALAAGASVDTDLLPSLLRSLLPSLFPPPRQLCFPLYNKLRPNRSV